MTKSTNKEFYSAPSAEVHTIELCSVVCTSWTDDGYISDRAEDHNHLYDGIL